MTDYIKRDIERIIANAQECDIDALTWEEQKERLKAVKSADVAPVRHGRWVESFMVSAPPTLRARWTCSWCGNVQTYGATNYCHNCGAKMDEEVD